ncbi:hypothetical protein LENED_007506 [Lentinula edodes]|uniref:Transmembrane protein n=1 Tax=Lentinula edodes TaxID=5353 RepID=A0A1Q3EEL7_LENED|nr:hypothetical protein LENED_007506 [Lentinula edodes]
MQGYLTTSPSSYNWLIFNSGQNLAPLPWGTGGGGLLLTGRNVIFGMASQPIFPIDEAQLTSVITEGIFYGNQPQIHINMLFGALCLLSFATLDLAAGIRLNLRVFLSLRGNTVEDFGNISYWVNVLKMVSFVGQIFTGDSILLYRCWVIYGRNFWVIAAPATMLAAELVCGCFEIYTEFAFGSGTSLIVSKPFAPYIITVIVLTVFVNISVTSLMIWRIWSIIHDTQKLSPSRTRCGPLSGALCILLDSGLMYTSSALIMLVTYVVSNNASYLVSDCLVQIIGITFNLIIIRVGRGTATQPLVVSEKTLSMRVPEQHSLHFRDFNDDRQSRSFDPSLSITAVDIESRLCETEGIDLAVSPVDDCVGELTPPPKIHSASLLLDSS